MCQYIAKCFFSLSEGRSRRFSRDRTCVVFPKYHQIEHYHHSVVFGFGVSLSQTKKPPDGKKQHKKPSRISIACCRFRKNTYFCTNKCRKVYQPHTNRQLLV